MQRKLSTIPALLTFAALAAGCGDPAVHSEEAVIDEPVRTISVDVGSGDVRVRGDDVSTVTVHANIRGDSNHLGHGLTAGHLSLVDDCHENHCDVDIDAVVPAGVPIDLHSGSGDLVIEATLGTIVARTGSGDIQGWDLAGADLRAETGSGNVTLKAISPAENIRVQTGSGDVSLEVPSGSYRLSVVTGSGSRQVDAIAEDASATASIDVVTGSGDVAIRGY